LRLLEAEVNLLGSLRTTEVETPAENGWRAHPIPPNSHLHETKYRPPALAATNSSGLFGSVAAGIRGLAEAGAQRIPFVGAPELEGFAHGHLAHRRRMPAGRLQFVEHLFADADDVLDQEAGDDRQLVAQALGLAEIEIRGLAAAHHVEQARAFHQPRHR